MLQELGFWTTPEVPSGLMLLVDKLCLAIRLEMVARDSKGQLGHRNEMHHLGKVVIHRCCCYLQERQPQDEGSTRVFAYTLQACTYSLTSFSMDATRSVDHRNGCLHPRVTGILVWAQRLTWEHRDTGTNSQFADTQPEPAG